MTRKTEHKKRGEEMPKHKQKVLPQDAAFIHHLIQLN